MRGPRGAGTLAAGCALLAAMWLVRPGGLALYDGLTPPTEPYRSLHPTATSNQKGPPTAYDQTLAVVGGRSPQISAVTGESTPQAALSVAAGGLVLPAGTASIRVQLTAVDPPAPAPGAGELDGNVYRMQVTANGAPVALAQGQQAYITLEGTGASGTPQIEVFASDGSWHAVATSPSGTANLWFGPVDVLGDAALVLAPHGAATEDAGLSTAAISTIVLGAVIAAAAAVLLAARTVRRRSA